MKLSILIRSLESRKEQFDALFKHLTDQINVQETADDVEILFEIDNKQVSSGAKANNLLKRAAGEYVIFIDDDDWVADWYVEELLNACKSGCDCFGINGFYSINGGTGIKWRLSKDNIDVDTYENGEQMLLRRTNHITAVKREIALQAMFPDKSNAEDKYYSSRLKLETEYTITLPMYWYRYLTTNKEYA